MKILYIEDDANLRRAILRGLHRMYDDALIKITDNSDDAIQMIQEATLDKPYDLVISDFNLLGHGTGGDILEWIKEHASYLEPRFLFLTSDMRASEMHYNFVEKPCDSSTLRTAIETVLNNARS